MTASNYDDFDRLEREVGEWAEANFGADQPEWYPLIGAVEELGEAAGCYERLEAGKMADTLRLVSLVGDLCHSVLKQAQGIRLDEDGVGPDVDTYLADRIISVACDIEASENVAGRARLEGDRHHDLADAVGDTEVYLADFSYRQPYVWTLGDAVALAWDGEVSDREWDADVTVDE
jgi:hypothetical protein